MLASIPGLTGLFGSILVVVEKYYYKYKGISIGQKGLVLENNIVS